MEYLLKDQLLFVSGYAYTGKTTFIKNLLKKRNTDPNKTIIFNSTENHVKDYPEYPHVYTEIDYTMLHELLRSQMGEINKCENCTIVFDNCIFDNKFYTDSVIKLMLDNYRPYRLNIIISGVIGSTIPPRFIYGNSFVICSPSSQSFTLLHTKFFVPLIEETYQKFECLYNSYNYKQFMLYKTNTKLSTFSHIEINTTNNTTDKGKEIDKEIEIEIDGYIMV